MTLIAILLVSLGLVIGVGVVIRFVQFWSGFAQGINEANGEPRGFEVKLNTGAEPVPRDRNEHNG